MFPGMCVLASKNFSETISDALWMSILAGLGGVLIVVLLFGGFYLFDPVAKLIIEQHISYFFASVAVIFLAGFGISLQFALKMQFWRGKWK
jgi:hypothetical protein